MLAKNDRLLVLSEVRGRLNYDPITGIFTRKKCTGLSGGRKAGSIAGAIGSGGYVYIVVCRTKVVAHRLAWLHYYGTASDKYLDHKDGCRTNNAIENLREASTSENIANSRLSTANKSGHKGVSWHSKAQKWEAKIWVDYTPHYLGLFSSKEDASEAYRSAAMRLFGEFARFE